MSHEGLELNLIFAYFLGSGRDMGNNTSWILVGTQCPCGGDVFPLKDVINF